VARASFEAYAKKFSKLKRWLKMECNKCKEDFYPWQILTRLGKDWCSKCWEKHQKQQKKAPKH